MAARPRRLLGLVARASQPLLLAVLLMMPVVPSASAGSNTWTRLTGVGKHVGGLAVAPSDSSILLARNPQGLLRSTDHGRTWALAGHRLGQYRQDMAEWDWQRADNWGWTVWIDPQDPRIVYSAVEASDFGYWSGFVPTSIYRSADGGKTWERVLAEDGGTVAIYPADPRIVYMAGTSAIWKSVDRGLTWSRVYYLGARDLAISTTDPDLVLALAGDYVVKSADGGRTWNSVGASEPVDISAAWGKSLVVAGADATYWSDDGEIWGFGNAGFCNPLDPSESFTPNSGKEDGALAVIHHTNWGRTRDLLPYPPTQTWVSQLVLDRGSPQTMYALAEDGVWAYTFGASPVDAGALPKTGSPDLPALPILAALAGTLSLLGLRLRRLGDRGESAYATRPPRSM